MPMEYLDLKKDFENKKMLVEKMMGGNFLIYGNSFTEEISLGDYLKVVKPHLSKVFADDRVLKDIEFLARFIPGSVSNSLGFECRLDGKLEKKSDRACSVGVSCKDSNRKALVKLLHSDLFSQNLSDRRKWKKVIELAGRWADVNSTIYDKSLGFWFEFDLPLVERRIPLPGIFFGPLRISSIELLKTSSYDWFLEDVVFKLLGRKKSSNLVRNITRCIGLLPPQSSVFQAGFMSSRDVHGVRLVIKDLPRDDIVSYLQSVGWKGDFKELKLQVNELGRIADRIILSFDVCNEGIGHDIGLECSFRLNRFHLENRWKGLLDYLVKKDMCVEEKMRSLLKFLGMDNEIKSKERWPKNLLIASEQLDKRFISTIVRFIGHIKIVYGKEGFKKTKAYFGIKHFWIPCMDWAFSQ